MQAPFKKITPNIAGPAWIYLGAQRHESDCSGCPLRRKVTEKEWKCTVSGDYEVAGRGQSCPCPSKPIIYRTAEMERPVCPEGSAIIDLRIVHWSQRAQVTQKDMDQGCIPAWADRGGEPRPLDGYSLEIQVMACSRSKWSHYCITWKRKGGAE